MKKFAFLLFLVPLLFSCKKERSCWCNYSSQLNGENYDALHYTIYDTEDNAIAECDAKSDTIPVPAPVDTTYIICTLAE